MKFPDNNKEWPCRFPRRTNDPFLHSMPLFEKVYDTDDVGDVRELLSTKHLAIHLGYKVAVIYSDATRQALMRVSHITHHQPHEIHPASTSTTRYQTSPQV